MPDTTDLREAFERLIRANPAFVRHSAAPEVPYTSDYLAARSEFAEQLAALIALGHANGYFAARLDGDDELAVDTSLTAPGPAEFTETEVEFEARVAAEVERCLDVHQARLRNAGEGKSRATRVLDQPDTKPAKKSTAAQLAALRLVAAESVKFVYPLVGEPHFKVSGFWQKPNQAVYGRLRAAGLIRLSNPNMKGTSVTLTDKGREALGETQPTIDADERHPVAHSA